MELVRRRVAASVSSGFLSVYLQNPARTMSTRGKLGYFFGPVQKNSKFGLLIIKSISLLLIIMGSFRHAQVP